MRTFIILVLLVVFTLVFLRSEWVCYSKERECPEMQQPKISQEQFLSAHGISQDTYSIWLKEHSIWRKENSDELRNFTFIPQEYDE